MLSLRAALAYITFYPPPTPLSMLRVGPQPRDLYSLASGPLVEKKVLVPGPVYKNTAHCTDSEGLSPTPISLTEGPYYACLPAQAVHTLQRK